MTMKKTEAAVVHPFRKWFKEQYGRLPNDRKTTLLNKSVDDLTYSLDRAKIKLKSELALNRAFQNALYGWNANAHAKVTKGKRK